MWDEQEIRIEVAVSDEGAHEREAVRVQTAGRKADHDVSRLAARPVDHTLALDEADARAGEVELRLLVDPGQFRSLSADQQTPSLAAHLGGALDELDDLRLIDATRGDVVEEEEWIGSGAQHVVDAVGCEIHSRPPQPSRSARQHQLRADAVHGGRE